MTSYAAPAPAEAALPWGVGPDGELDARGVKAGAAMGTLAVLFTFPLGILGIVLSCTGLDRIESDPIGARRLVICSWAAFVPGTVVGVVMLVWGLASLVG